MQQDSAEMIALKVLGWLASEEEVFPIFLGASGIDAGELKERAMEPTVLAAVLDFVTMNDDWVRDCCMATGLAPTDPMQARQSMPGGGDVSWT